MALSVLIVDDSATVRAVIAKTLRLAGLANRDVLEAANGRDALDLLRARRVDLVLSDLNMPVMDGFALIERMAEQEPLKAVPVIVVSTEGSAARIAGLKAKGVAAFIRKPFKPETLREVVKGVVEGGSCERQS
jgi:two-component system chemotaxis response regulator CheY